MRELSLHILDLVENSIQAKATLIKITIEEDTKEDILKVSIEDNGKGMDSEFLKKVTDPFMTTRKTRDVGLGIPLMKTAALRCEGEFHIDAQEGEGTQIESWFRHSHIDRAPLGDMGQTIMALINYSQGGAIEYLHTYNDRSFLFTTDEVKKVLDGVDIDNSEVLLWIKDYINDNIKELYCS